MNVKTITDSIILWLYVDDQINSNQITSYNKMVVKRKEAFAFVSCAHMNSVLLSMGNVMWYSGKLSVLKQSQK